MVRLFGGCDTIGGNYRDDGVVSMNSVKKCARCGEEKPLEEFYRYKGHSSGRQSYCKVCTAEANREWRSNPAVKVRLAAYMREYRRRQKKQGN